jgi:outer membrane protein, heavy metal efflux system
MLGRILFILPVIALISVPSFAKEPTLDDYIQKLAEHPQVLQIIAKSTEHKELSLAQMGLPDPTLSFGVENVPVQSHSFDTFLPTSRSIGFTQKFPSYALRKAKSKQHKQLSVKQQMIADFTKKKLQSLFISALTNLDKVKKQQQLSNQQINLYKELESYFKGRLESGSGVYWRFSQVDVERSLIEQKLNNLTAERDDIEAELIRLVGEVPTISIAHTESKNWKIPEDLYPIKIAMEDIDVAKFGITAANATTLHNYTLQGTYKQREDSSNFSGEDWFSVKASLSLPLWYKWSQAPKKRAATARKYGAEQFLEDTKIAWIKKLTSLESKRDATLKNIHLLVKKDSSLKEMIAAAKRTYESGETGLEVLLDSRINSLSIQSQLAEQRFKHLSVAAKINSYIGD